jgi:predicted transcriptional regulator
MSDSNAQLGEETRKRGRLEILLEILDETRKPTKKTHLLYNARINHNQLSRYLQILLDLKMVEQITEPFDGYMIAENGKLLLQLIPRNTVNLD